VKTALKQDEPTSLELRRLVTTHVHDLVVLTLGGMREAAELACGRGLRAARLSAVKADIANRLANEGLTVTDIASRQGVTPRYVQMLFEAEGTTFSEYTREKRLARAHRMLNDPALSDQTISAIALDAGFGNLSYFNRVFRRSYGVTPSDVRAAAWRADE
jgi:AraC-like DNA-binding protein